MDDGGRVAYFNGKIIPERDVLVSFRDRSYRYGDAGFDTSRTFGGQVFRLEQHVARLYKTLKYLRIDPGLTQAEMVSASHDVVSRNLDFLGPGQDTWINQRVSRGTDLVDRTGVIRRTPPTVIIECTPLPLTQRAHLFRRGIDVLVPAVRRTPPESLSPNAKTHNYLNVILAELAMRDRDPDAWTVLLDTRGFLAEGASSNIFLVRDGTLLTPKRTQVLPGISRETVLELAEQLGIPVREEDMTLYDAATADEAFLTATSLCLCPVRSIDGVAIADGTIPGPITARLTQAYSELVQFDFVAQYLEHGSTR